MRCPYCGGAMEDGFIQSARPIAFVKEMRWVTFRSAEGDPSSGTLLHPL